MPTSYVSPFEAPKWLERGVDGRFSLFLILPPLGRIFADLKLAWNEVTGRYSYDMAVVYHVLVCSEYMLASTSQIPEEVALAVIKAWYEDERLRYGAPVHEVAERLTQGMIKVPSTAALPSPELPLEWGDEIYF